MSFTDAKSVIEHIYALPNLHSKNDLSYIKKVLTRLDNPQNRIKTIHVTGTNGKGSTSYYLSNILKKAGQKTGLFVSPYIHAFNERIQVNGEEIPDTDLVEIANQIEDIIVQIRESEPDFSLVTFEYEVVLAFEYFAKVKCDYAVIEVGIGAEHDKTNVIIPEVSVITTIAMDHEKIIGPTLADIAREKSGVIKSHRPVVLGKIPAEVSSIIKDKAMKESAPTYELEKDIIIKDIDSAKFSYHFRRESYTFDHRPDVEEYDIALAVTVFELLDLKINKIDLETAINETVIPGRYQIISHNPTIILDGAHNIQAMSNLLSFIKKTYKDKPIKVLLTMMKDKDISDVLNLFDEQISLTLTTIPYPRAAKQADFPAKYLYVNNFKKAYQDLKNSITDGVLLVTGSFYLVSAILQMETDDESSRY